MAARLIWNLVCFLCNFSLNQWSSFSLLTHSALNQTPPGKGNGCLKGGRTFFIFTLKSAVICRKSLAQDRESICVPFTSSLQCLQCVCRGGKRQKNMGSVAAPSCFCIHRHYLTLHYNIYLSSYAYLELNI